MNEDAASSHGIEAGRPATFSSLEAALARVPKGLDTVITVDAQLISTGPYRRFVENLQSVSKTATVSEIAQSGLGTIDEARELGKHLRQADFVVAFGGGAVLDRTKVARAFASGYPLAEAQTLEHRGWWPLGDTNVKSIPFMAVPTTFGTGSEQNGNAVVKHGNFRYLVSGATLFPSSALRLVENYKSLSVNQVLEALFEALSRGVEAYSSPGSPRADEISRAVASQIIDLGDSIESSNSHTSSQLALAAKLSGMTHGHAMNEGREKFAFRAWCVAHEMAANLQCSKVEALAVVLPRLHALDDEQARPYGESRRRHRMLEVLDSRRRESGGSSSLFKRVAQTWRIKKAEALPDADKTASVILDRWGGTEEASHLRGFEIEDILPLVSRA